MADGNEERGVRIGLAEAVATLRAELSKARREAQGSDVRFAVDKIEVELAIEFTASREAGGGLKLFSLLDFSGKASAGEKTGHKLKLLLTAHDEGKPSEPVRITDEYKGGFFPARQDGD